MITASEHLLVAEQKLKSGNDILQKKCAKLNSGCRHGLRADGTCDQVKTADHIRSRETHPDNCIDASAHYSYEPSENGSWIQDEGGNWIHVVEKDKGDGLVDDEGGNGDDTGTAEAQ